MPYKLSKKSRIYGLLSLLLVSGMAAIPKSANAQEKACVITDAGKKVCGKLVRDSSENQSNTSSQPIATLKYPSLAVASIQLLKCNRKANAVNCRFSATMLDKGETYSKIYFFAAEGTKTSQATDNKGEDYIAEKITIGKTEERGSINTEMVQDQPISITISFKIPAEVNTVKMLSLLTMDYNGNQLAARFPNVDISR